jgi:hypothetical protein
MKEIKEKNLIILSVLVIVGAVVYSSLKEEKKSKK